MGSTNRFVAPLLILLSAGSVLSFAEDSLKVGDRAPDFTLPGATRDTLLNSGIRLSNVVGKDVLILAFYPADWSGGCTKEMCTMRDNFKALGDLGATVFGISGDYIYSHREWAKSLSLPFVLLSDHNHHVAQAYGSFNAQTGFNLRTIYVIDRKGTIRYIDPAYRAGSQESFDSLRQALASINTQSRQ